MLSTIFPGFVTAWDLKFLVSWKTGFQLFRAHIYMEVALLFKITRRKAGDELPRGHLGSLLVDLDPYRKLPPACTERLSEQSLQDQHYPVSEIAGHRIYPTVTPVLHQTMSPISMQSRHLRCCLLRVYWLFWKRTFWHICQGEKYLFLTAQFAVQSPICSAGGELTLPKRLNVVRNNNL